MIPLALLADWRRLLPGLFVAAAGLALLAGAAGAGWTAAGWRWQAKVAEADAASQVVIAGLTKQIADLQLAVAEQNKAAAVLAASTESARSAQRAAQQQAAKLAEISGDRIEQIQRAVAATGASCSSVLRAYWGRP